MKQRDPRPAHADSYYAASAGDLAPQPPLQGDASYDVCVIGGGISGCSAALHLAQRGYRVALLEGQRIGWGASGRSGGQMIFGYACEMARLRKLVGRDDARRLWDLSCEALDTTRGLIREHAIDCDFTPGQGHAAIKPRQLDELRQWRDELAGDYAYHSLELIEGEALQQRVGSQRYIGLLRDANSGHLHPLNYTLGLARAALAAGVTIYESSPALELQPGSPARVRTPQGSIRAAQVVCCGNAYLDGVAPQIRSRIMPVGTYILATEPLGRERAESLIADRMAIADMNFVLDYFRLSADHRLLFGGRVSYSKVPPPNLSAAMRRRMLLVYPQLADVRADYVWGGYVAITANRAPHFGRVADNVYFAQGFSGHGIALTGFAGKLIAEAVAGSAERFDLFSRIPHLPFPGGRLLRTPALVLAMAWYRLRDMLG